MVNWVLEEEECGKWRNPEGPLNSGQGAQEVSVGAHGNACHNFRDIWNLIVRIEEVATDAKLTLSIVAGRDDPVLGSTCAVCIACQGPVLGTSGGPSASRPNCNCITSSRPHICSLGSQRSRQA